MILSLMSHKEARRGMAYWKEKHQPIFNIIRFDGAGIAGINLYSV